MKCKQNNFVNCEAERSDLENGLVLLEAEPPVGLGRAAGAPGPSMAHSFPP